MYQFSFKQKRLEKGSGQAKIIVFLEKSINHLNYQKGETLCRMIIIITLPTITITIIIIIINMMDNMFTF